MALRQFQRVLRAANHLPAGTRRATSLRRPASAVEDFIPAGYDIQSCSWDKLNVNTVSLIGRIGSDVELREIPSLPGKVVTNINLGVKVGRDGETEWHRVEVWDDVAEAVAKYLPKGSQIQVMGRLKMEIYTDKAGMERKGWKIVANDIFTVEPYTGPRVSNPYMAQEAPPEVQAQQQNLAPMDDGATSVPDSSGVTAYTQQAPPAKEYVDPVPLWEDFFSDPNGWWDNRVGKKREQQPDFKRKDGGDALWMTNRNLPGWVQEKLEAWIADNPPRER